MYQELKMLISTQDENWWNPNSVQKGPGLRKIQQWRKMRKKDSEKSDSKRGQYKTEFSTISTSQRVR